jgi:CubicO group peptidase (beta-lactamase class C family)
MQVTQALDGFDRFIEQLMRMAQVPGFAYGVVSKEHGTFFRSYGMADLDSEVLLTPDTLYPIGSTTKALNATLIGALVDEGTLAWDRPARQYIPWLHLGDEMISSQVTLRDLLVMRTGLPRHDWVWLGNPMGRDELVRRLGDLELSSGFRERFQYNNLTATLAGYIAEAATGSTWQELTRSRILKSLDMKSTVFIRPSDRTVVASYHFNRAGGLSRSRLFNVSDVAPAGGDVYSNCRDMARWVAFNLGLVAADFVSHSTLAEIHTPRLSARGDATCFSPEAAYAMGWFCDYWRGQKRLSHSGSILDVNSDVSLFPQSAFGVVSYVTREIPGVTRFINEHLASLLLGAEKPASIESFLAAQEEKVLANRARFTMLKRVEGTNPSHAIQEYCGTYVDSAYGNITVCLDGDALMLHRGSFAVRLVHWHYDVWVGGDIEGLAPEKTHPLDGASPVQFIARAGGEIVCLVVQLEPTLAPISFEKYRSNQDGGMSKPA